LAVTRTIDPGSISGYNPNWFQELSPQLQSKAQTELSRVGAPAAPTDRPIAYGEYGGNTSPLPSYDTLPDRVKGIVNQAEATAFAPYMQKPPLQQQPEMEQLWALINQLMGQQQPMAMPNISQIYQEVLGTKQNLMDQRKNQAKADFDSKTLPMVRNQLSASGFLSSDARFQQENEARSMLDRTLASIEAELMADAYQEALQRAGYEADVAKAIADQTYRNKSLALQALNASDEMKYRQGMLGIEQGRLSNESLRTNSEYGSGGFRSQELGLQGRGLDIEQAGQNLQRAISLLSSVGVVDDNLSKTLAGLGLDIPTGTKTADMRIAEANQALQRELASMRGSSGGGSGGGSASMVGNMTEAGIKVLDSVLASKSRKDAENYLGNYGGIISAADRAYIQAAIDRTWPVKQGGSGGSLAQGFDQWYTNKTGLAPSTQTTQSKYDIPVNNPLSYILNLLK